MKNKFGNKMNSPGTLLQVATTAAVRRYKIDNRFILLMEFKSMELCETRCATLQKTEAK